ncbi:MAG: metallophosphoesterase [Elusimicrobia bacterium]|nr:metallophosphoesterase [Elusimicrobiota bacterium]
MLRFLLFFPLFILILFGMQLYLAVWVLRYFPNVPVSPLALRATAALIAASLPLTLYWIRRGGLGAFTFAYLTYLWLGISFIWFAWAVFGDCLALAARLAGAGEGMRSATAWGVLIVTGLMCFLAFWTASGPPKVRNIELPLAHLPKELDGFSIVQLSDVHLGVTERLPRFERLADQVVALGPDLVVMTGDFLDPGFHEDKAAAVIGKRIHGKRGTLAVLGNHEFYHGEEASSEFFKALDARLLRNEITELPGGLQVAGVDDIRTKRVTREQLSDLLSRLDPKKPSILLSHQPLMFDVAAERGVGLMLSGHTHRGQIFPFGFLVRLFYPRFYGLYREGGTSLYVTAGAGYWGPPMRLFAPPEIARFVLRSTP